MSVYFTSDLHLGHKLATRMRGFNSIEEHDDAVLASLSNVCGKRTVLWVLGDVAMNPESLYRLREVEGRKRLIAGNHDNYTMSNYFQVFERIDGVLQYKSMWLSHMPIHPQEMYRCKANVHGHIHKNTDSPTLGFPYININWDFWRRPLSLDEIKALVTAQTDGLNEGRT